MTNGDRSDDLRPEQWRAVLTLAAGGTHGAAAEAAGCSARTLRRWRRHANFRAAVVAAHAESVARAREHLAAASAHAVQVLLDVADDPSKPAAARVSAARTVLTAALDHDTDTRLTALEEAMTP